MEDIVGYQNMSLVKIPLNSLFRLLLKIRGVYANIPAIHMMHFMEFCTPQVSDVPREF